MVTIGILRCAVCIVELTVSATGRADLLLVSKAIVRIIDCSLGLTVSATGQHVEQNDC